MGSSNQTERKRPSLMMYSAFFLLGLVALGALFFFINRPRLLVIDAGIPDDFPDNGFSHAIFESLLHRYVDSDGRVDYERWHQSAEDVHGLDTYLAAVAAFSPDTSPPRFSKQSERLAYWLYAYNAYVVRNVLNHWPMESVTHLKAPLEIITGFGFFWRERFLFGGEALSLYTVENKIIRPTFRDPRIHFVLNCASESCPVLRPELPTGNDLEPFLASATIDFVSDRENVNIDHSNGRIILSDIFKWYEKDFINDLRRQGLPLEDGLVEYLISVAPEPMKGDLASARDYSIEFSGYDWSINDSRTH
jgi:hypothetical protein